MAYDLYNTVVYLKKSERRVLLNGSFLSNC